MLEEAAMNPHSIYFRRMQNLVTNIPLQLHIFEYIIRMSYDTIQKYVYTTKLITIMTRLL